jgi:NDP-sugar pyrophosphorylase family protein
MITSLNGMLLAAGRGERMEPLSTVVPKPALDVLGRPLLGSALAHLRRAGCLRVVVNLHRHPDAVAAAARDSGELSFSWEPDLLGGAGGLCAARPLLGEGAVLVANTDVWSDLDLAPLLAAGADGTVVLALLRHPDPARWSSVVLDGAGHVREILPPGAPSAADRYLFTGFQLFGSGALASLPTGRAEMPTAWDVYRRRGALRGIEVRGTWHEVGTPGAYRTLVTGLVAAEGWVHAQGVVAEGARVRRSAVGAGCRVGANAALDGSVLTSGAAVEAGCELRRCVAAGPVTLAGSLSDALIVPAGRFPLA